MTTINLKLNQKSINLTKQDKIKAYEEALKQIDVVLNGERYWILKMATINNILRENLPYYYWTGFYLVHKGELVVGPYQGTFGCLHIAFGRGVCGTAAQTKKTQIVSDVYKFKGHIACDNNTKSEIVVPVFNAGNMLIAVFDVDSTQKASFDKTDKLFLEKIFKIHFIEAPLDF